VLFEGGVSHVFKAYLRFHVSNYFTSRKQDPFKAFENIFCALFDESILNSSLKFSAIVKPMILDNTNDKNDESGYNLKALIFARLSQFCNSLGRPLPTQGCHVGCLQLS